MAVSSRFRFVICPVNSSVPIGELELSTVSFNDPVTGTGGSFAGRIEIPSRSDLIDQLRILTTPWEMALYVFDQSTGAYLWGGPIASRPWDVSERRLHLSAISWKSWLYMKILGPDLSVNPPIDKLYSATGSDQFSIARQQILLFVNADTGVPTINFGSELSGILRDFAYQGSQFKFAGDLIDSMANRDNGFDWSIAVEPDNLGNPALWFRPYWPKRGGVNSGILLFHQLPHGSNILEMGNPEDTASARRTRCWATGAGQPPDLLFAYDQDPALATEAVLLSERVDSYSTVADITNLAQHARTARSYYGSSLQQVAIKVALDEPDYASYAAGDKVRLLVSDPWLSIDFQAVRIVDRQINVNNEGDSADVDNAQIVLDLNDTELPENETQV